MIQTIPENLRTSAALKYIVSKGWVWQGDGSGGQIQVEECPFCHHKEFKFYVAVANPAESSRDGLFFCHAGNCQKTGNLRTLMEAQGDRIAGVESRKEWAGNGTSKPDTLPDVEVCHAELLGDAEAMDYLLNVRGFTQEIIKRQKLGLKEKIWFRESGESKALVIPYLVGGNIVYAKYRTLPPKPKDFISPSGWEAGLYNADALDDECKEIIMVEGEADCLSLLSHGVMNVVGVPGAGVRKAVWVEALDRINPKIYILFDSDQAGTKGAQELASRIGIERCLKVVLPAGVKDINEYFCKGGTLEGFEKLKASSRMFDVAGVSSSVDALTQLENELNGKHDLAPTYVFPWPELNRLIGMENGDILDVVACEKTGKTTFGMNVIDHMVSNYSEDGLIICLEMTQARLARKWVSLVTGFSDDMTAPGTEESKKKLEELKVACVKARETQQGRSADLYFCYPTLVREPEDIYKLIRDCIRRYGVSWVMLDNVQRLCDDTLKNQAHRTVHLSQISKSLAKITKDYRIKMLRILQPKRLAPGATISTQDVDGSSQVAKDCDGMITLWRAVVGEQKKSEWETQQAGFEESYESFEPIMRVSVGLSRYSAGGTTKLYYDGARSQVRSLKEEQKVAMTPERLPQGSIPMEGGGFQAVVMEEPQVVNVPTEGDITI